MIPAPRSGATGHAGGVQRRAAPVAV